MRRLVVLLALLGIGATEYPYMAADFEARYLGPLKAEGTAVHYAECAIPDGKVVLVLPDGAVQGRMVDLHWGNDFARDNPAMINFADVTVAPRIEIENRLIGGGARKFQFARVDFLLRRPMQLVEPDDFHSIIASMPQVACEP